MNLYQSEISNLPSGIKRSVAPTGKKGNPGIRREFGLPADKAFRD
jgi:hypothetical protein